MAKYALFPITKTKQKKTVIISHLKADYNSTKASISAPYYSKRMLERFQLEQLVNI